MESPQKRVGDEQLATNFRGTPIFKRHEGPGCCVFVRFEGEDREESVQVHVRRRSLGSMDHFLNSIHDRCRQKYQELIREQPWRNKWERPRRAFTESGEEISDVRDIKDGEHIVVKYTRNELVTVSRKREKKVFLIHRRRRFWLDREEKRAALIDEMWRKHRERMELERRLREAEEANAQEGGGSSASADTTERASDAERATDAERLSQNSASASSEGSTTSTASKEDPDSDDDRMDDDGPGATVARAEAPRTKHDHTRANRIENDSDGVSVGSMESDDTSTSREDFAMLSRSNKGEDKGILFDDVHSEGDINEVQSVVSERSAVSEMLGRSHPRARGKHSLVRITVGTQPETGSAAERLSFNDSDTEISRYSLDESEGVEGDDRRNSHAELLLELERTKQQMEVLRSRMRSAREDELRELAQPDSASSDGSASSSSFTREPRATAPRGAPVERRSLDGERRSRRADGAAPPLGRANSGGDSDSVGTPPRDRSAAAAAGGGGGRRLAPASGASARKSAAPRLLERADSGGSGGEAAAAPAARRPSPRAQRAASASAGQGVRRRSASAGAALAPAREFHAVIGTKPRRPSASLSTPPRRRRSSSYAETSKTGRSPGTTPFKPAMVHRDSVALHGNDTLHRVSNSDLDRRIAEAREANEAVKQRRDGARAEPRSKTPSTSTKPAASSSSKTKPRTVITKTKTTPAPSSGKLDKTRKRLSGMFDEEKKREGARLEVDLEAVGSPRGLVSSPINRRKHETPAEKEAAE